jgi:hypothetical protein
MICIAPQLPTVCLLSCFAADQPSLAADLMSSVDQVDTSSPRLEMASHRARNRRHRR